MRLFDNYRLWQLVLAAMAIPLALIAFWPSPVDKPVSRQISWVLTFLHHHGIPNWFDYGTVESSANVVMFVPVGFAAALAFPSKHWLQIGAFGLLVSGCIELGQLLFLHDRFAALSDLATNTTGAMLGAAIASLLRGKSIARSKRHGRSTFP